MKVTIRKRIFEQDFFEEQLAKSKSYVTFAKALGWSFSNGSLTDDLKDAVEKLKLNTDHFYIGQKRKYPLITKNCPVCNVEFETSEGIKKEKTTCSRACSNVYFSDIRQTEESKLIRSKKLKQFYIDNPKTDPELLKKVCTNCNENFEVIPKAKDHIYCSPKCARESPITREKLSISVQKRMADGTHKGWAKRDNLEPSYPEKYVIKLITELGYTLKLTDGYICNEPINPNNIILTMESKVSKWFIDFADINRKLALEIDGKQHDYPKRKASDKLKDEYLINEGWTILRIRWKKVDKNYREYLIKEIEKFFA